MTLLFMDGFDHYATADVGKKWLEVTGTSGVITIAPGMGRRSTASMRFTTAMSVTGTDVISQLNFANQPTWIVGAAIRVSGLPFAERVIMEWRDTGSLQQVDMRLQTSGTITVTRAGALLGTTSAALSPGTYTYVEWLLTIHNTLGVVQIRFNNAPVLILSNQDTQATTNAFASNFRWGAQDGWHPSTAITMDMDDLYICDGAGSAPHNTFLGDSRVDTLFPNADSTPLQWTPSTGTSHFALVDETAPNTTDYISNATAGHRDMFNLQDITAATGTIFGTQLNIAVLKSDAGARSIKTVISSGASESLTAAVPVGTSQTYLRQIQIADPATSVAWTEAGINSMRCGVETA